MDEEGRVKRRARSIFVVVLIAIGVVGFGVLGWFLINYKTFRQASSSMEPTLTPETLLLASRGGPVQVGDVVVFRHQDTMWVKRIIADGGDRVQMKTGRLFVNGSEVPRADAGPGDANLCWNGQPARRFRETNGSAYLTLDCGPRGDLDETGEYVVPAGHYFMMGDNRDNSLDSRVGIEAHGIGFVAAGRVFGKLLSPETSQAIGTAATDTP